MAALEYKTFEFKVKEVGDDGTFSGIASMYGEEDLGGDVIDKGAFTKTLDENPNVPILWQHQADKVIGSGDIKEWGRKVNLQAKLDLDDPLAVHALGKMRKKLIKGLSIGFQTIKSTWEEIEGRMVRHISELKLWEVSVVTFPMLTSAQITSVKSAREADLESRLAHVEQDLKALQAKNGTPIPEPQKAEEPPTSRPAEPDWVHSAGAVLQTLRG